MKLRLLGSDEGADLPRLQGSIWGRQERSIARAIRGLRSDIKKFRIQRRAKGEMEGIHVLYLATTRIGKWQCISVQLAFHCAPKDTSDESWRPVVALGKAVTALFTSPEQFRY